jgi:hypothetical protein
LALTGTDVSGRLEAGAALGCTVTCAFAPIVANSIAPKSACPTKDLLVNIE